MKGTAPTSASMTARAARTSRSAAWRRRPERASAGGSRSRSSAARHRDRSRNAHDPRASTPTKVMRCRRDRDPQTSSRPSGYHSSVPSGRAGRAARDRRAPGRQGRAEREGEPGLGPNASAMASRRRRPRRGRRGGSSRGAAMRIGSGATKDSRSAERRAGHDHREQERGDEAGSRCRP